MGRRRRRLAVGLFGSLDPGGVGGRLRQKRIVRSSAGRHRRCGAACDVIRTPRLPHGHVHDDADDGGDVRRAEWADRDDAADAAALAGSNSARFLLSVPADVRGRFRPTVFLSGVRIPNHRSLFFFFNNLRKIMIIRNKSLSQFCEVFIENTQLVNL